MFVILIIIVDPTKFSPLLPSIPFMFHKLCYFKSNYYIKWWFYQTAHARATQYITSSTSSSNITTVLPIYMHITNSTITTVVAMQVFQLLVLGLMVEFPIIKRSQAPLVHPVCFHTFSYCCQYYLFTNFTWSSTEVLVLTLLL